MATLHELLARNITIRYYGVLDGKTQEGEWPPSELDFPGADRMKSEHVTGDGSWMQPYCYNMAGVSTRAALFYLWLEYCRGATEDAWLTTNGFTFRGTPEGLVAENGVLTRLR